MNYLLHKPHRLDSTLLVKDALGRIFEKKWWGFRMINEEELDAYTELLAQRQRMHDGGKGIS